MLGNYNKNPQKLLFTPPRVEDVDQYLFANDCKWLAIDLESASSNVYHDVESIWFLIATTLKVRCYYNLAYAYSFRLK